MSTPVAFFAVPCLSPKKEPLKGCQRIYAAYGNGRCAAFAFVGQKDGQKVVQAKRYRKFGRCRPSEWHVGAWELQNTKGDWKAYDVLSVEVQALVDTYLREHPLP